jgi:hypothetical protein
MARDAGLVIVSELPPRNASPRLGANGGRQVGNSPSPSRLKKWTILLLVVGGILTLASVVAILWINSNKAAREWIEVFITGNMEGQVQVSSSPAGAEIYVAEKPVGITPSTITLKGKRGEKISIEVRRKEYRSDPCEVVLDREMPNCDIELEWLMRELRVETEPEGARVRVDEQDWGTTPITIKVTKSEEHKITLSRDWFRPVSLALQPDQELSIPIELTPTGALEVQSSYPVELIVGEQRYGERETHNVKLPAGSYSVTVRARDVFYLYKQPQLRISFADTTRLQSASLGRILIGTSNRSVTIDDVEVPREKHGVLLNVAAGVHTIRYEAPGTPPRSTPFRVQAGVSYRAIFDGREIEVLEYSTSVRPQAHR